jgi:hypothetical protein
MLAHGGDWKASVAGIGFCWARATCAEGAKAAAVTAAKRPRTKRKERKLSAAEGESEWLVAENRWSRENNDILPNFASLEVITIVASSVRIVSSSARRRLKIN